MWSKDFVLLVQGQAVSCFGDTLYSVVASLWVYEITGSTIVMSVVYSVANITRLVTFPLAGMIADSFSRRNLVVCCDLICGISMLAVAAVSTLAGEASVWALVAYSVISSICYGVFNSSISTLMLSLVKKTQFVQASSVYNAVEYGVDLIGQGIAGTLYVILGAPALFLINGLSFLFSAGTELFICKDPKPHKSESKSFFGEALEGVDYIIRNHGIRQILLIAFMINFSFGALRVALVPWMLDFGEKCYGLLGSFRSAGVILGTALLAVKSVPERRRYPAYYCCQILFVLCILVSARMSSFFLIAWLFCIAYANQYIFNSLQRSVVILSAPDEVRGKVICAIQALAMGFSSFGNLLGGILCQWIPPKELVFWMMILLLVGIVGLSGRKTVRNLFEATL